VLLVNALDEAQTYTGSITLVQLFAKLADLPPAGPHPSHYPSRSACLHVFPGRQTVRPDLRMLLAI
jgi:hypothetical protein